MGPVVDACTVTSIRPGEVTATEPAIPAREMMPRAAAAAAAVRATWSGPLA